MSPSAESLPRFGAYQAVRKLGEGGMGAVWEARHEQLGKRVAVKVLLAELARNAEVSARFLREGQAAARVRHPHVVDVYDVGSSPDGTYLVMELLEGSDLAHLLSREGPMSPSRAAAILLPVMSALKAAHAAGVVHRDLKPANIFVSTDAHGRPHPTVVDFGISKLMEGSRDAALTASSAVFGTPYYLAPEQAQGSRHADARSDQYSLGVILYECLTGRLPFEGDSLYSLLLAIATARVEPPSTHVAGLDPTLDAIVVRAMSREPSARFDSVRDLGRALLAHADPITRALWDNEFAGGEVQAVTLAGASSDRKDPLGHAETRPAFTTSVATRSVSSAGRWGFAAAGAIVLAAAVVVAIVLTRPAQVVARDPSTASPEPSSIALVPVVESARPQDTATAIPASAGSAAPAAPSAPAAPVPTQPVAKKTPPRASATPTAQPTTGPVRGANSAWIVR